MARLSRAVPAIDPVVALRREGGALAHASALGPERHVRIYPRWTVSDLVAHTGSVHRWAERMVRLGARQEIARVPQHERDPARLIGWFRDGVTRLAETLERTDPDQPVWTMAADKSAGFWRRRMAHETAVHRWDVEEAVGVIAAIDPRLAITGIPETLEIHVIRALAAAPVGGRGERIRIRSTDTPGEWTIRLGSDSVAWASTVDDVDATLSGSASAVWLAIMGRTDQGVELAGDRRAIRTFWRALRLPTTPSY